MKAHELIEELQKWSDLPVYFEYTLADEMGASQDGTMAAESVSDVAVKMVLQGPVSEGELITAVVVSGPK